MAEHNARRCAAGPLPTGSRRPPLQWVNRWRRKFAGGAVLQRRGSAPRPRFGLGPGVQRWWNKAYSTLVILSSAGRGFLE